MTTPLAPFFPSRSSSDYTYPQDGTVIGPAWELAWEFLGRAQVPMRGDAITGCVAAIHGNVSEVTVKKLLEEATKDGILFVHSMAGVKGSCYSMSSINPYAGYGELSRGFHPYCDAFRELGVCSRDKVMEHVIENSTITKNRFSVAWKQLVDKRRIVPVPIGSGQTAYAWVEA